MKVKDLMVSCDESLRNWRTRRMCGVEQTGAPEVSLLTLTLCRYAVENAEDVGTNIDSLTYPESLNPVEGLTRLLARQLVWLVREQPKRTDLIAKRSARFQLAVGLPLTNKYDFETATMAFVVSGASVVDVPPPEGLPSFWCNRGGICPVIQHWMNPACR